MTMAKPNAPTVVSADGTLIKDIRTPGEILWDKYTTVPLIVLSFVFLVGFSSLILDDLRFSTSVEQFFLVLLVAIWIIFIVDYLVRLSLSSNKKRFVKANVIDLLSVFIPFMRPFLILVYLGRLRFFRGSAGTNVRARLITYFAFGAIMYVYVLSLMVYAAERHAPGASITSWGDATWWAVVTITTVGYGDMVPITIAGRVYATFLMLGGMVIVGATTGTIISFLNEKIQFVHNNAKQIAAQRQAREEAEQQLMNDRLTAKKKNK